MTPDEWDRDAVRSRYGHVLQSRAWAAIRAGQGWEPEQLRIGRPLPVALVLWRRLPFGQLIGYVPRGPIFDHEDPAQLEAALAALRERARARRPVFLKVDAEIGADRSDLLGVYQRNGFFRSRQEVQPVLATFEVGLSRSEEEILAGFDKDTRWSVRNAEKRGVRVYELADDEALRSVAGLYQETGLRGEFITRPSEYYVQVWRALIAAGHATLYAAMIEEQIAAAAIILWCGERALYMYGASGEIARKAYASYALQWHCLRAARARGATRYDLGGIPVRPDQSDPLHGLYLFKKGFGGVRRDFAGAYDAAQGRLRYALWLAVEPRLYTALALARGRRPTMPVVR